ncbi:MAG: hypothetical protein NTX19_03555 [Gemmatimonadetes bacterium]|nr:hypothetical protein [Gemmatimonadota bacterium]
MSERDETFELRPRIIAWLVVGIPLAWGVAQVTIKSAALFQ